MKALLIVDIQNDYFENGTMTLAGSLQASEKAGLILENFRKEKLPIIFIQHIAASPDATFFLPDTEGAEIHKNVKPLNTEKMIIKHFPNSFRETELHQYLTELEVKELVICGMMTHMCIDATARAAKDLGYECTVIGDACATRNLEIFGESVEAKEVHKAFLSALNYFYAKVMKTEDYLTNH